jgi:hypothetical protein
MAGARAPMAGMRTGRLTLALALAVPLAVACGKKGSGRGGPVGEADPAPANAAVPAELKGKLEFEAVRDEVRNIAWVTPKGWKDGVIPGQVKPPEDAGLGFMTKYSVDHNCDGDCEAKDWRAVTDRVDFGQLAKAGKVLRDEKGTATRTMLVDISGRKELVQSWWKKGADHYVVCRASIEPELQAALPAFEAACKATLAGF